MLTRRLLPIVVVAGLAGLLMAGPADASGGGGSGGGSGGGGGGGGGSAPPAVAPIQLLPDSSALTSGTSDFVQVLLSPAAPAGGAVLALSASNASVALPSSLSIGAGLSNAQFAVTAAAVTAPTAVTVTVRSATASSSFALTVNPAAVATLATSVGLFPRVVTGGDVVQLTAGLTSTAPPGGVSIGLSSSNPGLLPVPASVNIPFGADAPQILVTAGSVTTVTVVTVTATFGGQSATGTVQIDPARVATTIGLSATTVEDSAAATGGVSVSVPADAEFLVALHSSNPAVAGVPAQAGVAPGESSAGFTITLGPVTAPTPVTISATAGGVTVSATLTVIPTPPPPFALQSLTVTPPQIAGTGTASATVHSNGPAPAGGITVKLSISDTKLASVPATVLIPAGATSAVFPVRTTGQGGPSTLSIGATYQNIGPAAPFGVTPAKGGTLLPVAGGPEFAMIAPEPVNPASDLDAEITGGGTKAEVESGQLPPGLSIVSIGHAEYILRGPLTKAGTYPFVLRFTGGNAPGNGVLIPYVWVITPS